MTATRSTTRPGRSGWAPAARCWPAPSPSTSPTPCARRSVATSSWSRSTTGATCRPRPLASSAAPASSSARCATPCCAARSTSPCTRSRTCRPRRDEQVALAAVPGPRGPARRGRRPRRPHPRRAAGRCAHRHRVPAPGRAAARARSRSRRGRQSAATWTPGSRKVSTGDVDAVVLARAGLARLGRLDEVTEVLDPLQMLPAPGQGALAVECRAADTELVGRGARTRSTTRGPAPR